MKTAAKRLSSIIGYVISDLLQLRDRMFLYASSRWSMLQLAPIEIKSVLSYA